MRVTHVTWGYPSLCAGHEATYFATQIEGLAKTGQVTVDVMAPLTWIPRPIAWCSGRWRQRLRIPHNYTYHGIYVHRPRFLRLPAPAKLCWDLLLVEAVIRRCLSRLNPDIVHVHGANALGLAALSAAKSMRIPSVLTLHGGDVYYSPLLSKRHRMIFAKAIQMPLRCIAVSSDLAEAATKMTGVPVSHLPIGIDMQRFAVRTPKTRARERFGLSRESRVVLYVGNLLQTKGVQVLLDALGRSAGGELGVFAGEGPMAPIVQQHPHARWIGPVSYEEVPALISAADVLVLPSFSEGLGQVLVEAGALGVPTIGTAVGGIPSLLDNGRGYLVPVNDAVALSQSIAHVLANSSEANEKGKLLQKYVKENHDAEVNSGKLLEIYAQLLSSNHSPAGAKVCL